MIVLGVAGVGAADPRVVELRLTAGVLPKEQRVIRVQQGDEVELRWTTDRPLALHLHGYDIEARITPGTPGIIRFRAAAAGRFAITVHADPAKPHTHERALTYLEVHPR